MKITLIILIIIGIIIYIATGIFVTATLTDFCEEDGVLLYIIAWPIVVIGLIICYFDRIMSIIIIRIREIMDNSNDIDK